MSSPQCQPSEYLGEILTWVQHRERKVSLVPLKVTPAQAEEAAGRVDSREGRGAGTLHLDSPHGGHVSQASKVRSLTRHRGAPAVPGVPLLLDGGLQDV